MRRLGLAALLLAFVAGGCMGGDDGGFEAGQLDEMVLLAEDLGGSRWSRFDWGKQARADQPSGIRSDPARRGRLDGWKARYRRPGSRSTSGPLVVESRADVFEEAEGATGDFDDYRTELESAGTELEELPDLGEEAILATLVNDDVRFYLVMWRQENAVAAINLNGFDGKLTKQQVLALARKQQARIDEA